MAELVAADMQNGALGLSTGLEYELVRGFAEHLGVELRLVVPPNFEDILPLVEPGSTLQMGIGEIPDAVLDFLEQQGALPRQAPVKWGLRRFSRT